MWRAYWQRCGSEGHEPDWHRSVGRRSRGCRWFKGNVHVTGQIDAGGDITCANGSDCAEYFDVAHQSAIDAGTVVVLGEDGALLQGDREYDKRVAGVVSGAGAYRPGILLDRRPCGRSARRWRWQVRSFAKWMLLMGAIEAGDLLTTSPTPGHAMKAQDSQRAFGAVLGKALKPFACGKGLLPVLVALQ